MSLGTAARTLACALGAAFLLAPAGAAAAQDEIVAALAAHQRGESLAAASMLQPLAEGGDAPAQHALGWIVEFGLGDPARAAAWYAKAAASGHAQAQNDLAALYYDGRGVSRDLDRARTLYTASAQQGYRIAQYNLALLLARQDDGRNWPAVVQWLSRAAASGLDRAQAQLASFYLEGAGVPRNAANALSWFRRAGVQGHAEAQYRVGTLLQKGEGTARDLEQAAHWFEKAAVQGHALAAYELAVVYELGLGLPADADRSLRHYERAAQAGLVQALERLVQIYEKGELGRRADADAAKRWRLKRQSALRAAD